MAKKGKLELLGEIEGKEYYLDRRDTVESDAGIILNPEYNTVVWRIPDIREAVVAEPGFLILSADYAQIEVKLMAHLSRDPVLIAAINSGKDIHSYNATAVFGEKRNFDYETMEKARKDKTHPRHAELVKIRNDIKTVTFGVPYGAGPNKVALMTGMSVEAAKEFIEAFFAKFSVLGQWLKDTGDFAVTYGFSTSPRGRRRFYEIPGPSINEKEVNKIQSQNRRYAGNHPIQAGNVDMLKPAMYQIYNDLREGGLAERGARIVFCVHDEIVCTGLEEDGLPRNDSGKIITLEELERYKKEKIPIFPGPIEAIMMKRMMGSYNDIIPDILNRIDVGIGRIWEKA